MGKGYIESAAVVSTGLKRVAGEIEQKLAKDRKGRRFADPILRVSLRPSVNSLSRFARTAALAGAIFPLSREGFVQRLCGCVQAY
jgi:hypothetical protein